MQQRIGPYRILEQVASGGQATVYRAWDTRSGSIIALKVMHAHLSSDETYVQRFLRKARIAATLDHPNIVRIYNGGEADGVSFIAMEYLPTSLHQIVTSQGTLPLERALDAAHQIALALAYAHVRQVVHRDIKPQNILLALDGTLKVTDFGIARAADHLSLTRTGMVMGTPQYMAPEQARGEAVDGRADVYSLGVLLYQLLTGQLPYQGDTPWAVLRQHMEAPVPEMRTTGISVPKEVEAVVRRAMAKEPAKRFQTAADMAQTLVRAGAPARPQSRDLEEVPSLEIAAGLSRNDLTESAAQEGHSGDEIGAQTDHGKATQAAPELLVEALEKRGLSTEVSKQVVKELGGKRRGFRIRRLVGALAAVALVIVSLGAMNGEADRRYGGGGPLALMRDLLGTRPTDTLLPPGITSPDPDFSDCESITPAELEQMGKDAAARGKLSVSEIERLLLFERCSEVGIISWPMPDYPVEPVTPVTRPIVIAPAPTPSPVPPITEDRHGGILRLALPKDPFAKGVRADQPFSEVGETQTLGLVFSRLLRREVEGDDTPFNLALEPNLAKWEITDDGREFILRLREDVRFHDGTALNAQHVVHSLKAAAESGLPQFNLLLENLEELDIEDRLTLRVQFNEPYFPFLELLASPHLPILRGAAAATDVADENPFIGTGPFMFKAHQSNRLLQLTRNPDYFHHKLPYVDTINIFTIQDAEMRLAAFKTGRLDFFDLYPGAGLPLEEWGQFAETEGVPYEVPAPAMALWFDTRTPPFSDFQVRRAVSLSMDHELWADIVSGGAAIPSGPMPEAYFPQWSLLEDDLAWTLRYDPEDAKHLLREAGYPGLHTTLYYTSLVDRLGAEVTAKMLSVLGGQLELQRLESGELAKKVSKGYEGIIYAPLADAALDAESYLLSRFSVVGDHNYSRIADRTVERLLWRQRAAEDFEGRWEIIQETQRFLGENVYLVPLPVGFLLQAHHQRVQGFSFQGDYDLGATLERVWLDPNETPRVFTTAPLSTTARPTIKALSFIGTVGDGKTR